MAWISAAVVTSGCCRQRQSVRWKGLVPIQLVDLRSRNVPSLEMRADAEGNGEVRASRGERTHRRHVEMIVVIVRDDHDVDTRQFRERHGWLVEPFRTDERRRRAALA